MANGGGEFQSGVDLRWSGCGFRCDGLVCYGFFRFGFCCYRFGWVLWPVVVGSNLGWICSGGGGGFVMDFFGSGFCQMIWVLLRWFGWVLWSIVVFGGGGSGF